MTFYLLPCSAMACSHRPPRQPSVVRTNRNGSTQSTVVPETASPLLGSQSSQPSQEMSQHSRSQTPPFVTPSPPTASPTNPELMDDTFDDDIDDLMVHPPTVGDEIHALWLDRGM